MSTTYYEPAKSIPVYGSFDVVIIGGGCAGFTAAIAAARTGASTLIIEQFPYFGGTATASLMANIVGFRNQVAPDDVQTTKGIGEELILNLLAIGGAEKSRNSYDSTQRSDTKGDLSYNYAFDIEKFKYVTLKMVKESGAKILFHTYFSDVIREGNQVKGVIIENKSGRQAVYAKVVIDASGDGDVAMRAGVPFWQTKKEEASRLLDCLMYKVTGFAQSSKIYSAIVGDNMILWGPQPGAYNCADADELTEAEINARLSVYDDLAQKQAENPGLENAKISDTGSLIGVRQTRFIEGVYQLTGEDVLEGRQFEDSVAMAANPIIHYYGYRRFLEHTGYDIPYRCMLPKEIDGLLVAGRCMSTDQRAFESLRAMAHILAIGEAAGTAAALSARQDVAPRDLDIKLLQKTLIDNGAEIGQGRKLGK